MARNSSQLSTYATAIIHRGPDSLIVAYHATDIVRTTPGTIELNTGGWDGVTTRRKMNQAATQFGLGYGVHRHKGESYVTTPAGRFPLFRTTVIDRDSGAVCRPDGRGGYVDVLPVA